MDALIAAIAVIFGALLAFHGGRSLSRSQKNALDVDTLIKLSSEVKRLNDDLIKVKNEIEAFDDLNGVLWQYVYALLENDHKNNVKPPDPPDELKSDPKLKALLKRKSEET